MMNLLVWSEKLLRIKAHSIATKLSQKCVTMCFNTRIPNGGETSVAECVTMHRYTSKDGAGTVNPVSL